MNKYFILLIEIFFMILLLGCSQEDIKTNNKIDMTQNIDISSPCTKLDGSKFIFAYVDYDPYETASKQLYWLLQALIDNGWIQIKELPFDELCDAKEMIQILSQMDLGPYIQFSSEAIYYIYDYLSNENIEKEMDENLPTKVDELLKNLVNEGKIDVILANGTKAGQLIKRIDVDIPSFVFAATNPVSSNIIVSSTKGSGDDFIWAQVEPSLPPRQLKYYYNCIQFKKLGLIIYGDEEISDYSAYEEIAKELNFEIVKYNIDSSIKKDGISSDSKKKKQKIRNKYDKLVMSKIDNMIDEGIDAFIVTPNTFRSDMISQICNIFYDKGIPVFGTDDYQTVKDGVLMLIDGNDFKNIGLFVCDAIGKVLNGAIAGDLPCIYTSAPKIYLNMDAANKLKFKPSFKFLMSCDTIYKNEVK